MQAEAERVKANVRDYYTRALEGSSCCGSSKPKAAKKVARSCCGGGDEAIELVQPGCTPAGRVVQYAGYDEKELAALPADAVANSFGCGNPLAFAGVKPGQVVVDIGSGAGIDCLLAGQRVGPNGRVIGVDMTPAMLEKARANAKAAGAANVEFRKGEAESMPIEDGTADWIISNCVINLSPDKPRVFREAYRVLKRGGQLSVSDIMVEKMPWFLKRSKMLHASCVAGAISESKYLEGLRQAGFPNVDVTERIVYDRETILSFAPERGVLGLVGKLFRWPIEAIVDRYLVNKIWSAKVVAQK